MLRGSSHPQQHCKGKLVSQALYTRASVPARAEHSNWCPTHFGDKICEGHKYANTCYKRKRPSWRRHRKSKDKEAAHTSYSGMDRTASTTARDIKCWINGILCPSCDLRGMETSRVKRAHPTGLSQAFGPLPGKTDPLRENCSPNVSRPHT